MTEIGQIYKYIRNNECLNKNITDYNYCNCTLIPTVKAICRSITFEAIRYHLKSKLKRKFHITDILETKNIRKNIFSLK